MTEFFEGVEPIRYEGPQSDNPFAFRWYDADRVVAGRTMAEHLRFGVCYWHTFAWDGFDIFGAGTLDRPWHPNQDSSLDPMDAAKMKMDAAFEFFSKLGAPFFSFHDVDMAPAGRDVRGELPQPRRDGRARRRAHGAHRRRSCCGARPTLFSHRRFMAGAATNPDPEVFRYAAAPGGALPERHAPPRRRTTTCCGAVARATRRCSTPT